MRRNPRQDENASNLEDLGGGDLFALTQVDLAAEQPAREEDLSASPGSDGAKVEGDAAVSRESTEETEQDEEEEDPEVMAALEEADAAEAAEKAEEARRAEEEEERLKAEQAAAEQEAARAAEEQEAARTAAEHRRQAEEAAAAGASRGRADAAAEERPGEETSAAAASGGAMPAVTAAVAAVAARVDSPAGTDKDKRRRARERPESQEGAGETPSETYFMEQMGDWLAGLPPTMPFHRGQVTTPPESRGPAPGPRAPSDPRGAPFRCLPVRVSGSCRQTLRSAAPTPPKAGGARSSRAARVTRERWSRSAGPDHPPVAVPAGTPPPPAPPSS